MTASAQTTARNTTGAKATPRKMNGYNVGASPHPKMRVAAQKVSDAYDRSEDQPRPDPFDKLLRAADECLADIGAPSPVRVVVACIVGTIAAAAGLYYGVMATVAVTTMVALAVGSYGFLAFLVLFAGYLVSIFAAVQAGGWAYYVVTNPACVRDGVKGAITTVRGWFTLRDDTAAAAA